jgi:K+-sensing histidine kinase KdpD
MTPRSSCNAELLRKAQLAARESGGAFYAVLLDSPRTRFGKVQADALDDVILASYFGAKIVWLKSSDAVGELIQFAKKTQAGRIFVARNQPHLLLRAFGRSVYSELLNRAKGLRIDVVGFGTN